MENFSFFLSFSNYVIDLLKVIIVALSFLKVKAFPILENGTVHIRVVVKFLLPGLYERGESPANIYPRTTPFQMSLKNTLVRA